MRRARQLEPEAGPLPLLAANADRAPVRLDHGLDDRQAEAGSLDLVADGAARAEEAVEELVDLVGRDTDALVLDLEREALGARLERDPDGSPRSLNLTAFVSRLSTAWPIRCESAHTSPVSSSDSRNSTPARSACGRTASQDWATIAFRSTASLSSEKVPASSLTSSSRSWTRRSSRCALRVMTSTNFCACSERESPSSSREQLRVADDRGQRRAQLVRNQAEEVVLRALGLGSQLGPLDVAGDHQHRRPEDLLDRVLIGDRAAIGDHRDAVLADRDQRRRTATVAARVAPAHVESLGMPESSAARRARTGGPRRPPRGSDSCRVGRDASRHPTRRPRRRRSGRGSSPAAPRSAAARQAPR